MSNVLGMWFNWGDLMTWTAHPALVCCGEILLITYWIIIKPNQPIHLHSHISCPSLGCSAESHTHTCPARPSHPSRLRRPLIRQIWLHKHTHSTNPPAGSHTFFEWHQPWSPTDEAQRRLRLPCCQTVLNCVRMERFCKDLTFHSSKVDVSQQFQVYWQRMTW